MIGRRNPHNDLPENLAPADCDGYLYSIVPDCKEKDVGQGQVSRRGRDQSIRRGAIFDPTQTYRYSLWREWNLARPRIGFIMLNPSRADAQVDDPTIRRCIAFAHTWNFGALEVVNLFAYRTSHPADLKRVLDPVGGENDRYLLSLGQRVNQIILAWGNWGNLQNRNRCVLQLLEQQTYLSCLHCLGMTKTGHPRHPLYVKGSVLPVVFTAGFTCVDHKRP